MKRTACFVILGAAILLTRRMMADGTSMTPDLATPRGAVATFLEAQSLGDAAALKAGTFNADADRMTARAAVVSARRELELAAVEKFAGSRSKPAKPLGEIELRSIAVETAAKFPVDEHGDTATTGGMKLKKVDGQWRVDASARFAISSADAIKLETRSEQIQAEQFKDVAHGIASGQYPSWPLAQRAAAEKIRRAEATDPEFQRLVQALHGQPTGAEAAAPQQQQQQGAATHVAAEQPAAAGAEDAAADARRTALVGGGGGGEFTHVDRHAATVIGFRYSFGNWNNRQVLRQLDPIFQPAAGAAAPAAGADVVVARPGYVVGGMTVDTDGTNAVAVRVQFVRSADGHVNSADHYESQWIGTPSGIRQEQLAGHGETVVGTFGRKGLNLDAVGLLLASHVQRSARVGGQGGSPFTHAGPSDGAPVVGFRYSMGDWGGPVLRQLFPLFDRHGADELAANEDFSGSKAIMARDGYVVAGLLVNTDGTNAVAVRVTFARYADGRVDLKDSYTTDWIGTPRGRQQVKLAGQGDTVVGTYGHKGMNLDAIGLLTAPPPPAK